MGFWTGGLHGFYKQFCLWVAVFVVSRFVVQVAEFVVARLPDLVTLTLNCQQVKCMHLGSWVAF